MTKQLLNNCIALTKCPACGSEDIESFHTIESFPAILFPIEKEKWNAVKTAPIQSFLCTECSHVFLSRIDKLFSDSIYKEYYYLYPFKGLESMQSAYREPFEKVARFYLSSKYRPFLLEIGCESVDQMKLFVDLGCSCTAINPGALPDDNIEFINGFYGIDKIRRKFDFIISRFNLEHIIDFDVFFSEIHENIGPDGIVIAQVPNIEYFLSSGILNVLAHEHPHYFCKKSFLALVNRYGFDVLHVSKADQPSLLCAFALPKEQEPYRPQHSLCKAVGVLSQLKNLIKNAPDNVILYGAGLSLTALLYDGSLDEELIRKIQVVDDNPLLDGRCMPNTRLEVVLPSRMTVRQNTIFILMLSEQYQSSILKRIYENFSVNDVYVINKYGLSRVGKI